MAEELKEMVEKTKRPYKKREPAAPITQPQVPNPTFLALEAKIFELSEHRSKAQYSVSMANNRLQAAQNELRVAQEDFARIDGEVNYRINLLNQMRGGPPQAMNPKTESPYWHGQPPTVQIAHPGTYPWQGQISQSPTYAPMTPYPAYPPAFDPRAPQGVSSYPARNDGLYPDLIGGPEGQQVGDAEAIRREEIRTRGY